MTHAKRNFQRPVNTAFTLIEVLIVVTVISVLIAVLLPCLRSAKEAARRALCASRLRQIHMGWSLYLDDSQGVFYQAVNANVKFGGWPGLKGYAPRPLNPYVDLTPEPTEADARLFECPADCGGVPGRWLNESVYRLHGNSFQANPFLIGQNSIYDFTEDSAYWNVVRQKIANTRIEQIGNPSQVLLAGDFGWFNQWSPLMSSPPEIAEWHGRESSFNMAYMDGHVSYLQIEKGRLQPEPYAVVPFSALWSWKASP